MGVARSTVQEIDGELVVALPQTIIDQMKIEEGTELRVMVLNNTNIMLQPVGA